MNRIAKPEMEWTFACGERDWLSGTLFLCRECRSKEPHERPETCPNMVKVDLGIKF